MKEAFIDALPDFHTALAAAQRLTKETGVQQHVLSVMDTQENRRKFFVKGTNRLVQWLVIYLDLKPVFHYSTPPF